MKFAEIIRNSGLDIARYPNCSNINIHLFDGKGRVNSEETIEFVKPLFEQNSGSLKDFIKFLQKLEKEDISSMNVKVDEAAVALFYKSPRATIFLRMPSLDPLDYME